MTENQFEYLVELMTSPQERAFLTALEQDPDDQATRNAYVDFLKDRGRDRTADFVQGGQLPHSHKVSKKFTYEYTEKMKKVRESFQQQYGSHGGVMSGLDLMNTSSGQLFVSTPASFQLASGMVVSGIDPRYSYPPPPPQPVTVEPWGQSGNWSALNQAPGQAVSISHTSSGPYEEASE